MTTSAPPLPTRADLPARADVQAAAERIADGVRRTPVLEVDGRELGVKARVFLKLELTQHTGSFKARGALNNVLSLPRGTSAVAAASGGNHGAAVAWAAGRADLTAEVFVPGTSTPAKLERIEEYGARLHRVDGDVGAALDACHAYAHDNQLPVLHPYDTFETLCGAGTLGLELEAQVPGLDTVLVACGGGGLFGGLASTWGGRVSVQPVEPELCAHLHDALAAGRPVDRPSEGIAADALGPPRIGGHAFVTARSLETVSVLVTEDAIAAARLYLWQRVRVLAEPAACAPLAAVMTGRVPAPAGSRMALVVSGGNNPTLP